MNIDRKLATIREVKEIRPIEGADRIVVAIIDGWECVVKVDDNISVGDKVVYIEIDSILPPFPIFEFMRERKFRVRTIKLRKQVSQGLALPLSYFPGYHFDRLSVGADVTEQLGITKYDPEEREQSKKRHKSTKMDFVWTFFMQFNWFRRLRKQLFPKTKGGWPTFIHRTDEERIQNCGEILSKYKDKLFYITEKKDGMSATYAIVKRDYKFLWFSRSINDFIVCSRNVYLKTPHACAWWDVATKFDIRRKLENVGMNICIQGEITGPGANGNKYGLLEYMFEVFNVFDVDKQRYFEYAELVEFCAKHGFTTVPILASNVTLPETVSEVVEQSKGIVTANVELFIPAVKARIQREGIVLRSMDNLLDGNNRPVSAKAINPDFLLKYDKE